jgi:hypothetical protein
LLQALEPKFVIAAHWEEFFTPYSTDVSESIAARLGDFMASVKTNAPGAAWAVPAPQQTLVFATR